MKTVKLNFDEQVIADLEAAVRIKRLEGKFGGVADMINLAILEALKANQPERTLRYRKKAPIINAIGR